MAVVFVDGDDVEFGVVEGGEGFECGWLPGLLVVVVVEEVGGVHSMGDCSMFRWLGEVKKATPAAVGLPELLFSSRWGGFRTEFIGGFKTKLGSCFIV